MKVEYFCVEKERELNCLEKAYRNLTCEIIRRAVVDYFKMKKNGYIEAVPKSTYGREIRRINKFFQSGFCDMIGVSGKELKDAIDKKLEEE